MSEVIDKLKELDFKHQAENIDKHSLIKIQKELMQQKDIMLPAEFVDFLHHYNGFSFNGGHIFGIYNDDILINNIAIENQMFDFKDKIILGYDEFDCFVYNQTTKNYEILDKQDLEVLEVYDNFDDGFFYIIKI